MDPQLPSRLTLELERDVDSFSGTASAGADRVEAFRGWIGLAAAVEAWRSLGPQADRALPAPGLEPTEPPQRRGARR